MITNPEDIAKLLTHTESLMNHVFVVTQDFGLSPNKTHHGVAINFTDIKERREDFLIQLKETAISWVYSKMKQEEIWNARFSETDDKGIASSHLYNLANSKFRKGHPQGQFGELILFNFIQHFFQAVPLLRKMNITTSIGHERFGSDAIHFKIQDGKNILYLGESKAYESKYQFNTAFKKALESILKSFNEFDSELGLYTYDDFIDPVLEKVAKDYKKGQLSNVEFQLICLVGYNENKTREGFTEEEIKSNIEQIILKRCSDIDSSTFDGINAVHLSRINYIIFPIWDFEELLSKFDSSHGG